MKKRIEWIDILRALSMGIVIVGHTAIKKKWKKVIYSFHMPLFFFISGLVFKNNESLSMKQIIIKKFKAYIIPYFFMHLIALPIWIINYKMLRTSESTLWELIAGAFYSNNAVFDATTNATWFITTLFLIDICFVFFYRLTKGRQIFLFPLIACFASLSFLESYYLPDLNWPWHMEVVPVGISLYYCGFLFMNFYKKHIHWFAFPRCLLLLLLIPVGYQLQKSQIRVSMTINRLGDPLHFYIVALSFTLSLLGIAMMIKRYKGFGFIYDQLDYVGKNTLLYIGIQIPIIRLFEAFFPVFDEGSSTYCYLLLAIFLFFAIIPINRFVVRFVPFVVSKGEVALKDRGIMKGIILVFFIITAMLILLNYKMLL